MNNETSKPEIAVVASEPTKSDAPTSLETGEGIGGGLSGGIEQQLTSTNVAGALQHPLRYSTLFSAKDNAPQQVILPDFKAFVKMMVDYGNPEGAKDGLAFAGSVFKPGTTRAKGNVEKVTMVVFDIDNECDPLDMLTPEAVCALFPNVEVFFYSSYSSTPEKQKFRAVFPLDKERPPEWLATTWTQMAELLGPAIDKACKDASRLYFLPRRPAGSDVTTYLKKHVVADSSVRIDDSFGGLSAVVEVAEKKATKAKEDLKEAEEAGEMPPTTVEHANRVLVSFKELPAYLWACENAPTLSRELWRAFGVNLATLAKDCPGVEAACNAEWVRFSQLDAARFDAKKADSEWKECRRSAKNGPITYGHMTATGGLPAELVKGASAAPISEAYKGVNGAVHQEKLALCPPQDYCLVLSSGRWYHWNGKVWCQGMSKEVMLEVLNKRGISGKKAIRSWMDAVPHVEAKRWVAGIKERIWVDPEDGHTYMNYYRPPTMTPVAGDWTSIRKVIDNLTSNDPAAFEFFTDWLAAPVQRVFAGEKPEKLLSAVIVQSDDEGAGKGVMATVMSHIYGAWNYCEINQEYLDGSFTGVESTKLFVHADEIKTVGSRNEKIVLNKLKKMITDTMALVNAKFERQETVSTVYNMFITTNERAAIRLPKGDRRYSTFSCKQDLVSGNAVMSKLNVGDYSEVQAFLHYLLSKTITRNFAVPFQNAYREEMQELSESPVERFAKEVTEFGIYGFYCDAQQQHHAQYGERSQFPGEMMGMDKKKHDPDGTTTLSRKTVSAIYAAWCRNNNINAASNASTMHLFRALKKVGMLDTRNTMPDSQRVTVTTISAVTLFGTHGLKDEVADTAVPPKEPEPNNMPF